MTILVLVEGTTDLVFYEKVLSRVLKARLTRLSDYTRNKPLREFIARFSGRVVKASVVGDVLVVSCGGFDGERLFLRELLRNESLAEILDSGFKINSLDLRRR